MPKRGTPPISGPVRLLLALLAVVAAGTLLLMAPFSARDVPLAWNDALFFSVSALCVTGLATEVPAESLSLTGKIILTLLVQLGGIGYIVLAVVVFQFLGRSISLTERIELQDELGMVSLGGITELAKRVLGLVLGLELIGAILLMIAWRDHGSPGMVALYAAMTSIISFCQAGFDLLTGSAYFEAGLPIDGFTRTVMVSLIVLGGIGIPVVFELIRLNKNPRLSLHTRLTLVGTAGLVIGGAALLWMGETNPAIRGGSAVAQVGTAMTQAAYSRTAGFSTFDLAQAQPATELTTVALMFVGSAAASTGGGIGVTTLLILLLGVLAYAQRRERITLWGRTIDSETFRRAGVITTVSLLTVAGGTWLLTLTHNVELDVAFFEATSAFTTTGLSLGMTTELNLFGQMVVCLLMVGGRLGPLTLIFLLSGRADGKHLVRYPEEKVLL